MKNKLLLFLTTLLLAVTQLWGQTFNQITSQAELTSGEYLIVGDGAANDGIMLNQTISAPAITYTSVTNPGATISSGFTTDNIFTVTVTGSDITIYHSSVGYVSWGRGAATGNHASFYNDTPGTNETWTASVSEGLWTLSNGNTPARILQWNNSSPRFAAYTTNQIKLKLYKKEVTEPSGYTITVIQPTGGSISPEGVIEVEEGGSAEFTATASECYTFNHWLLDGANVGNTSPFILTNVTADHTITAVFDEAAPYTITSSAGANGTITPNGATSVNCGEDQIFTFTADAGYIIDDVIVDGSSVGAVATYTFTNVSANHTISVSFEELSEPGDFCFEEGFTGLTDIPTGTNYGPGTYTNNGITWDFHGQSPLPDYAIDGQGILLRRASDSFLETTIPAGVGTFSFEYRKAYTGGSERQLELLIDGVQVATTPGFGSGTGDDPTVYAFSYDLNTETSVVVRIKLTGNTTTNRHTTIDNITWTCLSPPCETPLPTAEAQSFCGTTIVADLVAEGTDLKWYDSLEATEALSADAEVTTGTYYVTQTIDCESERLAMEITVNAIPVTPTAEAQTFCDGATVADLVAEGTDIKWYETEESTEPLAADFVLVTGVYYATQTVGECESERLAVDITINSAPVFTTQPTDQTVAPGETATFTVETEGNSEYQWSVSTDGGANWTVIDDATEATYTTEPATLEMDGNQYSVTTTNDCGETTSETAILNVEEVSCGGLEDFETTDIPSGYSDGQFTNNGITWTYGHSRNEEAFAIDGKGLMLRRASDSYLETTIELGVGEFTFEYRKAFTGGNERQLELIVNGEQVATTPVFGTGNGEDPTVHTFTHTLNIAESVVIRIKNVGTTDTNRQTVIDNISWTCAEDSCETPLPTAEAQVFCGEATVADLVAEGENIQWYETQTSTEPLAPEVTLVTGTYYVTQTIDCESDRLAVDVLISEGPVFTLQPADQTVNEGETATFTVEVEGALEYQWSVSTDEGANWTIIDDATEATYTTEAATQEMDGNQYRVTATNDCGETISEIAILSLVGEPCYVEDFETTDISDAYSDGSFTNNGITWTYGHSRNQGDFPIDEKGLMLRRASDSYLEATIPAGAGVFSFEYRKAFTGGNDRQLELIVNGEQVATTPVFGSVSGEDPTVYTFTYTLNSTEDVVIRIKNVGETDANRQTVIDNINWTCAEEPCNVPAPIAIGNFEFVAGDTLADLEDSLEYTGTLTWYADEELTTVLPNTTLLEDGAVYFVTQTIGECESDALTVETHELGLNAYGFDSFSYYPNPVKDILSLKNGSVINRVEIYNLSGAKVWTNEINAANAELNLSGLDTGIYVMKITAGKEVKTVKIIKK